MSWLKRDVRKLTDILDAGNHETVDDLAVAVLDAAEQIIRDRGKYTVVGQQVWPKPPPGEIPTVALGWFPTLTQAQAAAEQLTRAGEWRAMTVEVWHASPAKYHQARAAEAKQEKVDERAARVSAAADREGVLT